MLFHATEVIVCNCSIACSVDTHHYASANMIVAGITEWALQLLCLFFSHHMGANWEFMQSSIALTFGTLDKQLFYNPHTVLFQFVSKLKVTKSISILCFLISLIHPTNNIKWKYQNVNIILYSTWFPCAFCARTFYEMNIRCLFAFQVKYTSKEKLSKLPAFLVFQSHHLMVCDAKMPRHRLRM